MNEDSDGQDNEKQEVRIKFLWKEEPEIPLLFTNYTFVRSQGNSFLISFGEAEIPRKLDLDDETRERYESEGIAIRTVARLAMSPDNVQSVIKYLSEVYGNWLQSQPQNIEPSESE